MVLNFDISNYIFIPGSLTLILIIVFVICEKLVPFRKTWRRNKGDVTNDFLRTFLVLPAANRIAEVVVPLALFFPISWLTERFGRFDYTRDWGLIPNFILALLGCELFYYWYHRAGHKYSFLWRFHSVHHGAKRVYWLNSGRFHFIDAFISSVMYLLPLLFLSASEQVVILVITFSAITGFMEHVNIDFKAGWLNYCFNTAELHRWHHSEKLKESNKNFGKVFIIWDILFGTYHLPKNKYVGEVGIEGVDVPKSYIGQMMHPFKDIQ